MNRLTLRFHDAGAEARYQASIKPMCMLQMRLALLFVGILYTMVSALDLYFMPEALRQTTFAIHLAQGIWLMLIAALLYRSDSLRLHLFLTSGAVLIAWGINQYLSIREEIPLLYGEAYLMLIWTWMISGLSMRQAGAVNLLFMAILAIAIFAYAPAFSDGMALHLFFIFTANVLAVLGAYLTEFHRRKGFISYEALAQADDQITSDRLSLMKLSQAMEQSGEAIIITDDRATIEYVNHAFTHTTGYTAEDVLGEIPTILKPDLGHTARQEIKESIRSGKVWHGTFDDRKRDGTVYPTLVSIAPIQDEGGTTTHYVLTQKDMTEHRQLEDQLRHAQKMEAIGTLAGGIAHDFNNTLAGITGNLWMARAKVEHMPETLGALDRIEALAFRSSDMVKQLLAFSRKDVIHMQRIRVSPFLEDAINLYRATLPKSIRLDDSQIHDDKLSIHGDANQLTQVIFNLLNNARDAVMQARQPEICLHIETWHADHAFRAEHPELKSDKFVRIGITDNGCGIEQAQMAHIFEPFFTTKAVDEGTGLGLSMAYGTARSHGGTLMVESTPGHGTTIRLCLPLMEEDTD